MNALSGMKPLGNTVGDWLSAYGISSRAKSFLRLTEHCTMAAQEILGPSVADTHAFAIELRCSHWLDPKLFTYQSRHLADEASNAGETETRELRRC